MTYDELFAKIRSGAYDAKLKLPTGFTRGADSDPDIKNALHDGKVERQALEAMFRKDFAAMLHDEYGLSADKADIVYSRAISDPASDGSDMSVLAAARGLVHPRTVLGLPRMRRRRQRRRRRRPGKLRRGRLRRHDGARRMPQVRRPTRRALYLRRLRLRPF